MSVLSVPKRVCIQISYERIFVFYTNRKYSWFELKRKNFIQSLSVRFNRRGKLFYRRAEVLWNYADQMFYFQTGKNTSVVRVTGVSRHNGGPIQGSPHWTLQYDSAVVVRWGCRGEGVSIGTTWFRNTRVYWTSVVFSFLFAAWIW